MFCALTIIFPFARIPLVLDEKISQTFLVPIKNEFIWHIFTKTIINFYR